MRLLSDNRLLAGYTCLVAVLFWPVTHGGFLR